MINNKKTASFLVFSTLAFSSFNVAADNSDIIENKIENLAGEIKLLRNEVKGLSLLLERLSVNDVTPNKWGCHMDVLGGAYYGTGDTKAEAKGKTLHSCKKQQKTGCFENKVECANE